jgi:potassium-transporting ATPase potassium-binding subunit
LRHRSPIADGACHGRGRRRTPRVAGCRRYRTVYTLLGPGLRPRVGCTGLGDNAGISSLTTNSGAHGFTAVVFASASALANNGQAFAGLSANSPFWNLTTILAMLVGRLGLGVAAMALAGRFGEQPIRRPSLGTLQTDTWLFAGVGIATAIVVVALNYFPALALGPII